MSYSQYDVVLMLFPFTEKKGRKQRPAVVLSSTDFNELQGHSIVAMVTTASVTKWKSDLALRHVAAAGLHVPCFVRAKLFTIAHELLIGRVGTLSAGDAVAVGRWSSTLIGAVK